MTSVGGGYILLKMLALEFVMVIMPSKTESGAA